MTNQEIENRMENLVRTERKITREILTLINMIDERRIHLSEGYGSMFDYLVRKHGYSESAAQRRIQSARLLKATPEIASKISSGELTLSTMAKVQSSIKIQEKASGEKLTQERKLEIIKKVEGKTFLETENTLMRELPELALSVHQERRTKVDDNTTRVSANISDDALEKVERIKELFAHQLHGASLSEVIEFMAERIIKTKLGKTTEYIGKAKAELNEPAKNSENIESKLNDTQKNSEKFKTIVVSPFGISVTKNNSSINSKSTVENPSHSANETLKNAESAAGSCAKQRVTLKTISPRLRRDVFGRAQYQCEYINPITKLRCTRRYQLEVDHIQPKAFGGNNSEENLRCLCRNHNQFMAMKNLGRKALEWRGQNRISKAN